MGEVRLSFMGAFLDSTGIVRARVAGSGDASTSSTLKPFKRQTTNKLRFRSLITCERASTLHRPCAGIGAQLLVGYAVTSPPGVC